jgi:hypothetical protein
MRNDLGMERPGRLPGPDAVWEDVVDANYIPSRPAGLGGGFTGGQP